MMSVAAGGQPVALVVIRRGVRITVEITPAWSASR
jgi:hypothetical protein